MNFGLAGRVIAVTGAAYGIGPALSRQGADMGLTSLLEAGVYVEN